MNARIRLIGIVSGLLLASGASADALRCGSKLITEGDSLEKVHQYCGEPTATKRGSDARMTGS